MRKEGTTLVRHADGTPAVFVGDHDRKVRPVHGHAGDSNGPGPVRFTS